jgi:hypothetical protein
VERNRLASTVVLDEQLRTGEAGNFEPATKLTSKVTIVGQID